MNGCLARQIDGWLDLTGRQIDRERYKQTDRHTGSVYLQINQKTPPSKSQKGLLEAKARDVTPTIAS